VRKLGTDRACRLRLLPPGISKGKGLQKGGSAIPRSKLRKVKMSEKKAAGIYTACLVLIAAGFVADRPSMGQSLDPAYAVGTAVTTQINCGERAGGLEPYNATITLMEVARGGEAWNRLKAAGESNPEPRAGYEYILARIAFEMKARGKPGDKTFELGRKLQFTAFSADFEEYGAPDVVLPKPDLKRRISAGERAEGWVAFEVKKADSRPLMLFDPSSGGAMQRGKTLFFKLYR